MNNPNGVLVQTLQTDRAGDSCNYHWNLDPKLRPEAIAGLYTFTVDGENGPHEFAGSLTCSKPGKK